MKRLVVLSAAFLLAAIAGAQEPRRWGRYLVASLSHDDKDALNGGVNQHNIRFHAPARHSDGWDFRIDNPGQQLAWNPLHQCGGSWGWTGGGGHMGCLLIQEHLQSCTNLHPASGAQTFIQYIARQTFALPLRYGFWVTDADCRGGNGLHTKIDYLNYGSWSMKQPLWQAWAPCSPGAVTAIHEVQMNVHDHARFWYDPWAGDANYDTTHTQIYIYASCHDRCENQYCTQEYLRSCVYGELTPYYFQGDCNANGARPPINAPPAVALDTAGKYVVASLAHDHRAVTPSNGQTRAQARGDGWVFRRSDGHQFQWSALQCGGLPNSLAYHTGSGCGHVLDDTNTNELHVHTAEGHEATVIEYTFQQDIPTATVRIAAVSDSCGHTHHDDGASLDAYILRGGSFIQTIKARRVVGGCYAGSEHMDIMASVNAVAGDMLRINLYKNEFAHYDNVRLQAFVYSDCDTACTAAYCQHEFNRTCNMYQDVPATLTISKTMQAVRDWSNDFVDQSEFKPVAAAVSGQDGGNAGYSVFDGVAGSGWNSGGWAGWITLDLGEVRQLRDISIYASGSPLHGHRSLYVYTCPDLDCTSQQLIGTFFRNTEGDKLYTVWAGAAEARFVKIDVAQNGWAKGWVWFGEVLFNVFSPPPAVPPVENVVVTPTVPAPMNETGFYALTTLRRDLAVSSGWQLVDPVLTRGTPAACANDSFGVGNLPEGWFESDAASCGFLVNDNQTGVLINPPSTGSFTLRYAVPQRLRGTRSYMLRIGGTDCDSDNGASIAVRISSALNGGQPLAGGLQRVPLHGCEAHNVVLKSEQLDIARNGVIEIEVFARKEAATAYTLRLEAVLYASCSDLCFVDACSGEYMHVCLEGHPTFETPRSWAPVPESERATSARRPRRANPPLPPAPTFVPYVQPANMTSQAVEVREVAGVPDVQPIAAFVPDAGVVVRTKLMMPSYFDPSTFSWDSSSTLRGTFHRCFVSVYDSVTQQLVIDNVEFAHPDAPANEPVEGCAVEAVPGTSNVVIAVVLKNIAVRLAYLDARTLAPIWTRQASFPKPSGYPGYNLRLDVFRIQNFFRLAIRGTPSGQPSPGSGIFLAVGDYYTRHGDPANTVLQKVLECDLDGTQCGTASNNGHSRIANFWTGLGEHGFDVPHPINSHISTLARDRLQSEQTSGASGLTFSPNRVYFHEDPRILLMGGLWYFPGADREYVDLQRNHLGPHVSRIAFPFANSNVNSDDLNLQLVMWPCGAQVGSNDEHAPEGDICGRVIRCDALFGFPGHRADPLPNFPVYRFEARIVDTSITLTVLKSPGTRDAARMRFYATYLTRDGLVVRVFEVSRRTKAIHALGTPSLVATRKTYEVPNNDPEYWNGDQFGALSRSVVVLDDDAGKLFITYRSSRLAQSTSHQFYMVNGVLTANEVGYMVSQFVTVPPPAEDPPSALNTCTLVSSPLSFECFIDSAGAQVTAVAIANQTEPGLFKGVAGVHSYKWYDAFYTRLLIDNPSRTTKVFAGRSEYTVDLTVTLQGGGTMQIPVVWSTSRMRMRISGTAAALVRASLADEDVSGAVARGARIVLVLELDGDLSGVTVSSVTLVNGVGDTLDMQNSSLVTINPASSRRQGGGGGEVQLDIATDDIDSSFVEEGPLEVTFTVSGMDENATSSSASCACSEPTLTVDYASDEIPEATRLATSSMTLDEANWLVNFTVTNVLRIENGHVVAAPVNAQLPVNDALSPLMASYSQADLWQPVPACGTRAIDAPATSLGVTMSYVPENCTTAYTVVYSLADTLRRTSHCGLREEGDSILVNCSLTLSSIRGFSATELTAFTAHETTFEGEMTLPKTLNNEVESLLYATMAKCSVKNGPLFVVDCRVPGVWNFDQAVEIAQNPAGWIDASGCLTTATGQATYVRCPLNSSAPVADQTYASANLTVAVLVDGQPNETLTFDVEYIVARRVTTSASASLADFVTGLSMADGHYFYGTADTAVLHIDVVDSARVELTELALFNSGVQAPVSVFSDARFRMSVTKSATRVAVSFMPASMRDRADFYRFGPHGVNASLTFSAARRQAGTTAGWAAVNGLRIEGTEEPGDSAFAGGSANSSDKASQAAPVVMIAGVVGAVIAVSGLVLAAVVGVMRRRSASRKSGGALELDAVSPSGNDAV